MTIVFNPVTPASDRLYLQDEHGVFRVATVGEVRKWLREHKDDDMMFCEKHECTTWGVTCPDCLDGKPAFVAAVDRAESLMGKKETTT